MNKNSQESLSQLTNLSQQRISQFQRRGTIDRGENLISATRKIIAHLGEIAAGRRGSGPLDLVQERARLAAEMADKTNFELRKARGEFVPGSLVARYWHA